MLKYKWSTHPSCHLIWSNTYQACWACWFSTIYSNYLLCMISFFFSQQRLEWWLKRGASPRRSFGLNSTRCSAETTIGRTHPTLPYVHKMKAFLGWSYCNKKNDNKQNHLNNKINWIFRIKGNQTQILNDIYEFNFFCESFSESHH